MTFGGFDELNAKLRELDTEAARLSAKLGAVPCAWECGNCGESGTAQPFARPGETPAEAAARFALETRSRCVKGCAFTATPAGGNDGA
jgi:hypothetical protein